MPNKLSSCIFIILFAVGCGNKSSSENETETFCDLVNRGDDLYPYWMDKSVHDSLLTVVEACDQTPDVISARLDLLSLLGRYEDAIKLISTLNRSDFKTSYDSISSLNFFKVELTNDTLVKRALHEQTLEHISVYLKKQPLDTFALGHYCGQALKIFSEEQLYLRLDSMSSQNDFDSVYEFIISGYLPNYLNTYKEKLESIGEEKAI